MAKPVRKRKFSFILTLASIVMVSFLVISYANLRSEVKEQQAALDDLVAQCEQKENENAQLEQMLDKGGEAEYIERIARDELGYVIPGERVYIDISSGS